MRYKTISTLFLILLSPSAFALSGRTADGCTYKIINGQYLTQCDRKEAVDTVASASAAPSMVTSYDAVPIRNNPSAPRPSVQAQSAAAASAGTVNVTIATPSQGQIFDEAYERRRRHDLDRMVNLTYVGAVVGSSTVTKANSGSSLGFGANIGTNLDEYFAIEMGYSYSKQDLNLGLKDRGQSEIDSLTVARAGNDSALKSHLITAEFQGHATDIFKRFRPYLGLGLGWKASTLTETTNSYAYSTNGGSLSQNSFGGLASAGTKLGLGKSLQLGLSFRYFFPFARQDSRLEQAQTIGALGYSDVQPTRLTKADEELTGSSQYQFFGGLQYAF